VIGTIEEAKEIFEAPENNLPPGWERIGTGGTRQVYRAPSGVVYKVCWDYEDDEPTHNDREHRNFNQIRRSGRLPRGWKVPDSHLHIFRSNLKRWDFKTKEQHERQTRVSVLACEYVAGRLLSAWDDDITEEKLAMLRESFAQVGLHDIDGANAVQVEDGYYIIDAGEDMITGDN
jgi:hypothetical protein